MLRQEVIWQLWLIPEGCLTARCCGRIISLASDNRTRVVYLTTT
ncbi:MAG: hypothetical protein PHN78_00775 [Dehalococcoidales bacterium]|nr:hypothetical protein [Dehalococcoidales bacterium]